MKGLPFFSRQFPKFKPKPVTEWLSMMAKNGSPAPCSPADLPHFQTCLQQIFQFNPDMRPSCKALLHNPYFASIDLGPSCGNTKPTCYPGSDVARWGPPIVRSIASDKSTNGSGSRNSSGSKASANSAEKEESENVVMTDANAQDAECDGKGGDNMDTNRESQEQEGSVWEGVNFDGLALTEMKC